MEQERKWSGIAKPKALRSLNITAFKQHLPAPGRITSAVRPYPNTPSEQSISREDDRKLSLAGPRSLETLASLCLDDEDKRIQECAMLEEEMRLRSSSCILPDSEELHSYPLRSNARAVPERPSNPMSRDSTFALSCGAEQGLSDGERFSKGCCYGNREKFCGQLAPTCVFN